MEEKEEKKDVVLEVQDIIHKSQNTLLLEDILKKLDELIKEFKELKEVKNGKIYK